MTSVIARYEKELHDRAIEMGKRIYLEGPAAFAGVWSDCGRRGRGSAYGRVTRLA